ncbi:MAG: 4'-phosphopantetheinyl transferase superfamily protein [Pseudolabrys sp.]|nr:4'-phosphopantetheinyl transferase superfamily protein [Pseudolabrys sp.]
MTSVALSRLRAAVRTLSKDDLLVDCRLITPGDEDSLSRDEIDSIAAPNMDAQRASGAARIVARELLAQLGSSVIELRKGWTGAAVWPEGFTGSMAHDAALAAAAVGRLRAVRGIGLDLEAATPLAADMMDLVLTPAELQRVGGDALQAKSVFVAKEAIYKALNPLDGRFLEYHDISVDLPGERAVTRSGKIIDLRFCKSTHIVALAIV